MEEVKHYTVNGKYRIVVERAASTKGVLGYKVEANADDMLDALKDIEYLKNAAERITENPVMAAPNV